MHGRLGTGARVRFAREARPKSALRSLAFYPTKLLLVGRRQWEAKGGRGMPHVHMIGKESSCHRSLPDTPCQRIVSMYTVSSKSLLGTPCQHSQQAQAPSTYCWGVRGGKAPPGGTVRTGRWPVGASTSSSSASHSSFAERAAC